MAIETDRCDMSYGRALLTDGERRHLSRESGDEQLRYEAAWRVRKRINEELPRDVEILEEHHPKLLNELRSAVCKDYEDTE